MTTAPETATEPASTTWELQLAFGGAGAAEAARVKREALAWLHEVGLDCIADGVVDGVDVKVEDVDVEQAFGTGDATAVLVFDASRERLVAAAEALASRFGASVSTRLSQLEDRSWREAWDGKGDEVFTAGDFAIVNDGAQTGELPVGITPIRVERSEAFGDGRHATTLAALEVLSRVCRGKVRPRGPALDVGTGSGVLAIAAAHLGYGEVVATEIDPEALAVAGRNAERAVLAPPLVLIHGALPPSRSASGERFALVLANILVPVLHDLMPRLAESLADGGVLVLAGFVEKEASPLLAAARSQGLELVEKVERRGWFGLALTPSGRAP